MADDPSWAEYVRVADKTCFIGDSHGDGPFIETTIRRAFKTHDCRLHVQVGDFGFWPGPGGQRYLQQVEEELARKEAVMITVDGNHDWHEWLETLKPGPDGLNRISPHLWHAPRGTVFPLPGADRCLAVGGAPSIDQGERTEGVNWWRGETLSHHDIERAFAAIDTGPIDVVVSHDLPLEVNVGPLLPWPPGDDHRRILSAIGARAQPARWFAGHYHRRVTDTIHLPRRCHVEVLDCNDRRTRATLMLTADQMKRPNGTGGSAEGSSA